MSLAGYALAQDQANVDLAPEAPPPVAKPAATPTVVPPAARPVTASPRPARSIASNKPGQPINPALREFLRYLLSREGQQALLAESGYLPLGPAAIQRELAKLQ